MANAGRHTPPPSALRVIGPEAIGHELKSDHGDSRLAGYRQEASRSLAAASTRGVTGEVHPVAIAHGVNPSPGTGTFQPVSP